MSTPSCPEVEMTKWVLIALCNYGMQLKSFSIYYIYSLAWNKK